MEIEGVKIPNNAHQFLAYARRCGDVEISWVNDGL